MARHNLQRRARRYMTCSLRLPGAKAVGPAIQLPLSPEGLRDGLQPDPGWSMSWHRTCEKCFVGLVIADAIMVCLAVICPGDPQTGYHPFCTAWPRTRRPAVEPVPRGACLGASCQSPRSVIGLQGCLTDTHCSSRISRRLSCMKVPNDTPGRQVWGLLCG